MKCEGVDCASYQSVGYYDYIDQEAIYIDEHNVVLYNAEQYWQRVRFTLAHELGHKVLSHYNTSLSFIAKEQEANKFAAELLCPSPLVYLSNIDTIGELCSAFDVSNSCAEAIMLSYNYFSPERWHYFVNMFRGQFRNFIKARQNLRTKRIRSKIPPMFDLYEW